MTHGIEYLRMGSIGETVDRLADLGPAARVLAGGTDLLLALRRRGEPCTLLDVGRIPALRGFREEGGRLLVGAGTPFAAIAASPEVLGRAAPLAQAAARMGNPQVRNRATLGGNLCHASPCADSVPALLALDARLCLVSRGGERWLSVEETVDGPYSTTVGPAELLTQVALPGRPGGHASGYVRLARRRAAAKARMAVAVVWGTVGEGRIENARVGCGSVTPRPHRMRRAEAVLEGRFPRPEVLEEAAEAVAVEMVEETGVRWSTEYKRPVVRALALRAFRIAAGLEPQDS